MVENVPCNAGDEGSIPDMRKIPHATGPLSLYATTKTRHSQIRKKETYSVHIGLRTLRGFGHPLGATVLQVRQQRFLRAPHSITQNVRKVYTQGHRFNKANDFYWLIKDTR